MNYCTNCGAELSKDANYCKRCGAETRKITEDEKELLPSDETNAEFAEEGATDDEWAYEDVEGLEEKGLDLSRAYYMTIDGHRATMRMDDGRMVRQFTMRTNIVQATTSGEFVTIITDDGYTHLFTWEGRLVRRMRN